MSPRRRGLAPIVDADTRVLILGSLPGERSLAERRYYAHPQNQFWRLIGAVIGVDLAARDDEGRRAALRRAGIGLWDVIGTARRQGSADAAIRDPRGNDIVALAAGLPRLAAIGFNGGTALRHGRALLHGEHRWTIVPLPSSSPLHTIGIAAKLPAWLALAGHLDR